MRVMSEEARPGPEIAGEGASALLTAVSRSAQVERDRVSAATRDLFGSPATRLSDLQLGHIRAMFRQLINEVEDDIRSRLSGAASFPENSAFQASVSAEHVPIAIPLLERSGLLKYAALVSVVLRRSDIYRVGQALKQMETGHQDGNVSLLDDPDERISAAAMAQLIAESRSDDGLGMPVISVADIPDGIRNRLYWHVAAALREYGVRTHKIDPFRLDEEIVRAVSSAKRDHDRHAAPLSPAVRIADLLQDANRLTDEMIADTLSDANTMLYCAMLAKRADTDIDTSMTLAVAADARCHALLVAAADIEKATAARLILIMGEAVAGKDDDLVLASVAAYEKLDPVTARRAIGHWKLDDYRDALADLAASSNGLGL